MRGLITAIRTLTIFPVPGRDADDLTNSLVFFPVVGALIGLITALASMCIGTILGWPAGAGAACVVLMALMTRGIHLDGLADVVDALGAGSREHRLAVMKDPHIGSFGVIAVAVCLLVKYVSFSRLSDLDRHWWIIIPCVASRTVMVEIAACLPYARENEGTGKRFIEGARLKHFVIAAVIAGGLCFTVAGWHGLVMLAVSCTVGLLLVQWMRDEFGGATGDLLGMSSEIIETLALFISALLLR